MVLVITKRQKQLLSRKIVACNTTGWDGLTHPYVDSAREASSVKLCSLEHIRSLLVCLSCCSTDESQEWFRRCVTYRGVFLAKARPRKRPVFARAVFPPSPCTRPLFLKSCSCDSASHIGPNSCRSRCVVFGDKLPTSSHAKVYATSLCAKFSIPCKSMRLLRKSQPCRTCYVFLV